MNNAELPRKLLSVFFKAPTAQAALVMEDNEYLGLFFKKDAQIGLKDPDFEFSSNINFIDRSHLKDIFFRNENHFQDLIPVIDKEGRFLRTLSFKEYQSQFFFDDFFQEFSRDGIWDNADFPLLITNGFKKILYMNKKAFLIAEKNLLGKKFHSFLKFFEIEIVRDKMILSRENEVFELRIHISQSKHFEYQIYQLF